MLDLVVDIIDLMIQSFFFNLYGLGLNLEGKSWNKKL